jgi:hypothetical protein
MPNQLTLDMLAKAMRGHARDSVIMIPTSQGDPYLIILSTEPP